MFAPFKLAARISAGDPPKTGEEWIAAFGRREVAAAFPFSVVESLLNGLEVSFQSKTAVLEFHSLEKREEEFGGEGGGGGEALRMVSRVHVDFDDGRVAGDLVTECLLVETEMEEEYESTNDDQERRRYSTSGDDDDDGDGDESGPNTSFATATATATAACLVSTRFEDTSTVLDGVVVPSGRIMGALMSPSPNLRRQRGPNGLPGVRYQRWGGL